MLPVNASKAPGRFSLPAKHRLNSLSWLRRTKARCPTAIGEFRADLAFLLGSPADPTRTRLHRKPMGSRSSCRSPTLYLRPAWRRESLLRRHRSVRPVTISPIAEVHWPPLAIQSAYGEDVGKRGRHMQAFASVVARCGHDQDVVIAAKADSVVEPNVSLTEIGQLSAADIDDVRAMICGHLDGTSQIQLRGAERLVE